MICPKCSEKRLIGKVGYKTYFCRNCLTEFKENGEILLPIYGDKPIKNVNKASKKDVIVNLLRKGFKPPEVADKTGYSVEQVYSYRNTYREEI